MVDISKATNLLTSLGIAPSVAEQAAQRLGKDDRIQAAQAFLKELQDALSSVATQQASAPAPAAAADANTTVNSTKPAQIATASETATVKAAAPAPAPAPAPGSSATAPFVSFEEFKHWEANLGNKFAPDYKVPDYIRAMGLSLNGGEQTAFQRFTFFQNNPQYAADYQSIRSGGLSKFPTDGTTLVKSDLSAMPTRIAEDYKKNVNALLMVEGFNMDPTLYKMRMEGSIDFPKDTENWLTNNRWTTDGPKPQDNRTFYANADYIGLDGKGAGTYKLAKYDPATGALVGADGQLYDGTTGTRIA